jgi:hypothetical protein
MTENLRMKVLTVLLIVLGCCWVIDTAPAAQSDDCKQCREDHRACVKAHSQGACKSNYDICVKHCQKK